MVRSILTRRGSPLVVVTTLAMVVAGCATATPSASPGATAAPSVPTPALPSASPSVSAAPGVSVPPDGSVVVTLEVAGGQTYRILLTDPADVAIAYAHLAGEPGPAIPNGRIIRGDGDDPINRGYTWSIDPGDFEWADVTTEVCDGVPSDVESGTLTSDRYCPWSARVVAVDPI